jgi:hypothetical protein
MRSSLGSVAALAAAMLLAFDFWPESWVVQGPAALFAQNKAATVQPAPAKPARSPAPTDHPLSSDVGQDPKIEAALDSTTDFTVEPEPLKDAVEWFASRYQIPVMLDDKALKDAGIHRSAQVRLSIAGLTVRQALTLMLRQLPQPLGFDIQNGVLRITTLEKIREHRIVVVYDCRDLVRLRSIYPAANSGMGQKEMTSQKIMDAAVSGSLDAGSARAEETKPFAGGPPELSAPEIPLIRVIRYAGDVDDWIEDEGTGPSVTELGGLLVVNQNPMVHEQIKRILADLRRMKQAGAFESLENEHHSTRSLYSE